MAYVYHDGMALEANPEVLAELGLSPGQGLTKAQVWAVIFGKAAAFSAAMRLRKAQGLNAPDMSGLDAALARVQR